MSQISMTPIVSKSFVTREMVDFFKICEKCLLGGVELVFTNVLLDVAIGKLDFFVFCFFFDRAEQGVTLIYGRK